MSAPENPAALPCTGEGFQSPTNTQHGMTLRDWFAGQVMAQCFAEHHGNDWGREGVEHAPISAARAYGYADAMLVARTKPPVCSDIVLGEPL